MMIVTPRDGIRPPRSDRVAFLEPARSWRKTRPDRLFGTPQEARTRAFLQRNLSAGGF